MPSPIQHPDRHAEAAMRRRMRSLQDADSTRSSKTLIDRDAPFVSSPSSFTPESDAETTDDDGAELSAYDNAEDHPSTRRPSAAAHSTRPYTPAPPEGQPSWYQFDAAVVLALVSCMGNFFTGGDHLKHIALAALLVFYLHQIIEVPWHLYLQARPRIPHSHHVVDDESEPSGSSTAADILRQRELAYLALSAVSPFIGVLLLTRVTTAYTGDPHALSWFSRTLFVLAAGVRPWRHLSDRLSTGTDALHVAIHYPPKHRGADVEQELADLRMSVARIEHALSRLDGRSREVCEYVDDALDVVERRVRRQERRAEKRERERVAEAKADTVFMEAPRRAPSLASYLLPWWLMQQEGGGGAAASAPASSRVQGKRTSNRNITLETIPEDGVLPSPSRRTGVPQTGVPPTTGNAVSRLVTLPLRVVLRLFGLG
ncbi:hypothetical protein BD626DRAFT_573736 [Schizophyllum amplum]|uniref:Uncharacterized protein n=1 Tax=Schizophyllum amplum TaxID=97359 RepID=A0A550C0I0_9AGAR|nr:hypothetical protein BD626DRAFT_573736 [Auriculariopsis ampla]